MSTIIFISHTEKMSSENWWLAQGCTQVLAVRTEPALLASHFCALTRKPLAGFPHHPVIEQLSLDQWRFRNPELINALALLKASLLFTSDGSIGFDDLKRCLWRDNRERQIKDGDSLTLSDKGRGRARKHLLRFYRLPFLFKCRVWKLLRGTLSR